MFELLVRRILYAVPTMIALSFVIFLMVKAIPGDPAQLLLGERATKEALEKVREEMGLNKPILVQYGLFLEKLILEGDLGRSITTREPVSDIISDKFPATIELAVFAVLFAAFIGLPLGLLAALRPGSLLDITSMGISVTGVSMPVFWLGLILMLYLGLEWQWLPISGRMAIEFDYDDEIRKTGFLILDSFLAGRWDLLQSALRHVVLPALTLGTIPMAFFARMTRASMLEVLNQDYIRTARAKGLNFVKVFLVHGLRNASLPIITVMGLQFGTMLAGAMITETIFSWPGMGRWILDSVYARDIPAIEGAVLIVAMAFVIINLTVDLISRSLDPRIRIN